MRSIFIVILFACGASLAALERGTPATIHLRDGKTLGPVYLLEWTFEKATFLLEQGKQARGEQRTDTIQEIELRPNDRNFPVGESKRRAGKSGEAIAKYKIASQTALAAPSRLLAKMRMAECYADLRKWDEASAGMAAVVAEYPQWVYAVEAQYLQGAYLVEAGKDAEAQAVFAKLNENAAGYGFVFGQKAKAKAAIGLATILRRQKKNTEAAELTGEAIKVLDPRENPNDWAKLCWTLVGDYVATKQEAKAEELYLKLRFAPVDKWYRGAAFLALAKLSHAAGRRIEAFDRAAIAALLVDGGDVYTEAKQLADTIVKEIRADANVSNAEKEEYISYLRKL